MNQTIEAMLSELKKEEFGNIRDFLLSPRKKVFFGQGHQASIYYEMSKHFGIEVTAFTGGKKGERYQHLPQEIPFFLVDEFPYDDKGEYDVLLALNEKYYAEARELLEANGFFHIYYSNDCTMINEFCRSLIMRIFLEEKGEALSGKILDGGMGQKFKIYNGIDQPKEYVSMLTGEFFDIIAPSIYGCYDYLKEGAYELDAVQIEPNDVVFDLGANIGMFACVAAAKGEHVYAFEPTPYTRKMLEQNAELYDNFDVVEYAICEKDGEAVFTMNDLSADQYDTGMNTLFGDRVKEKFKTSQIKVKTRTIDTFIKESDIEKVDFIKADIEGAERYMLMGAKETLKKYAPKLALCTYHLPDDEEIMTKLILEANPSYKIIYRPYKLYAYVPSGK